LDPVTGPCNSGFWKEYQKFKEYKYEIIETLEEPDDDVLVEKLNQLETFHILRCHAYDPQYGCNRKYRGTESTGSERILQERAEELYNSLKPVRLAMYESISDKVWQTKEPLTEEEKEYLTFHSFNEIAQHFGVVRPDNVRNVLKGRQKSACGYFWKYRRDL